MGGKGQIIAQCSKVQILTRKPIPMQVDGEPCLLAPSLIKLSLHSKVIFYYKKAIAFKIKCFLFY